MVPIDPYHPRIRVRWPEGGWIVWNWHTCKWDFQHTDDVSAAGESFVKDQAHRERIEKGE